ncbi:hypothetical protein ACGWZF_004265 [Enterobacter hormaechei]
MTDNMHKTQLQLVPKNGQPGWITLADIPDRGTTFIMQRYLLTHIETQIDREEGMALVKALLQHFDAPAPSTIPHGHGPVGAFYAQLDEARAQDHTHISLSRGHANLLAEHIRLLEEQLAALQSQVHDRDRVRRLNEHAAIINLLGHVEDGSDQTVAIFQDDATRTWWVRAGKREEYGDTLSDALRAHFPGADHDSQQMHKSLSEPSRPKEPCCAVTKEELSLLENGDYTPEELWGVGGKKTCPKCVGRAK